MKKLKWPHPYWLGGLALFAILFGLITLKEGGSVLFINGEARHAAGHYVPFVLWFNFIAGFAYIVAGGGLWAKKSWAAWLAICIAVATLAIFVVFGFYIFCNGVYEVRTVIAMSARTLIWMLIAVTTWKHMIQPASR